MVLDYSYMYKVHVIHTDINMYDFVIFVLWIDAFFVRNKVESPISPQTAH